MDPVGLDAQSVDFVGTAQLLLTGPFYPGADPLDERPVCSVPADGILDPEGRIVPVDRPMDQFLRGSLTFGNPPFELLTHFAGSEQFNTELTEIVAQAVDLPVRLKVTGMLFPDGYGSVAVRMAVADGWGDDRRRRLIDGFGPKGRDPVSGKIRDVLLPALVEVSDHCSPGADCETLLPYFNLTYVGETSHSHPGRGTLSDELRQLVYPRSPAPITSDSPWVDEFFYAGYAFSLLAAADPRHTLDQLEHLLLHLDVLYARMDRSASAADRLIRASLTDENLAWLIRLESRLRADYQALVRPTFSYDHHVLKLRDGLLYAWETDKTRERTETLLQMAREAVERRLAEDQARRVARVNLVVTILVIVNVVASLESAINLWTKWF
ncbi:MAG TPA: hypothetical protein VFV67_23590 [Actinophytocola sp.]|uniref:hypothetical protein n=1 Tax=Actinophytocola sp. TaxID=1872138 RepID=UPI002DBF6DDE|nr:hypothetical protein [Actinophytocola sp.]HEU5473642.1 hypothetical protein [Actinophytocola sp.]